MGTNVFRDFFAGITDLVGGSSGTYESELRKAKDFAIAQMVEDAGNLGADAVVGVGLDYEHLGGGNRSMLMVTANGTAVRLLKGWIVEIGNRFLTSLSHSED